MYKNQISSLKSIEALNKKIASLDSSNDSHGQASPSFADVVHSSVTKLMPRCLGMVTAECKDEYRTRYIVAQILQLL